ncbi:MAG: hypothetical protein LBL79_11515 [Prevotella sp.]|jgi:hypothetical protein|nr:hypothetical protein [Prevotella sp.]
MKKINIPVLLIGQDAEGNRVYKAGTRSVDLEERECHLNASIGNVIVEKIKQNSNRKIDQRVLATEIGFNE